MDACVLGPEKRLNLTHGSGHRPLASPSGPGLTQSLPSLPTCQPAQDPWGFTIPDPNVQAPPHWGAEAKG